MPVFSHRLAPKATFRETAAPAWLEIDMRHVRTMGRGKSRMKWFATPLRQGYIADPMKSDQAIVWDGV
jgi:hypothetical protein